MKHFSDAELLDSIDVSVRPITNVFVTQIFSLYLYFVEALFSCKRIRGHLRKKTNV